MSDQLAQDEKNNDENAPKTVLEITAPQLKKLETLLELVKTIGSTEQLALAGLLAAQAGETIAVADLLPELSVRTRSNLPRHLRQLEKAGFIQIQEWQAPKPGQEPEPALLTFNPDYARQAQSMISALRQVITLDTDEAKPLALDERAATIRRFMKDGKLVGMPVQVKRQQYILEEVARTFEMGVRYAEREVDAILKPIYEDHCTLRRSLVDFKYLRRENGIYWKENPVLAPA
jgi:predicted transcriptional regulator